MNPLASAPNVDPTRTITSVEAAELTPTRFREEFLERMRPVVVRGAVRHWPAFEHWRSPEYLRDRLGNPNVGTVTRPLVEPPGHDANKTATVELPLATFLEQITTGARGHRVLHAYELAEKSPLAPIADDVGGFPFLPGELAAPRIYPRKRAFLYRDSYTDWHYHETDETLMSQVKGAKEVLILPPDAATFALLSKINAETGPLWDVDRARYPGFAALTPYRVVVEPGDALYIPTFYWHAVASLGDDFGCTVAWCWGTPLHLFDPRLAGVRSALRASVKSGFFPLAAAAAAWSLLHVGRLVRPAYTV